MVCLIFFSVKMKGYFYAIFYIFLRAETLFGLHFGVF